MTRSDKPGSRSWSFAGLTFDTVHKDEFVQIMLENVDQRNLATMRISEEDIDNAMRQRKKAN